MVNLNKDNLIYIFTEDEFKKINYVGRQLFQTRMEMSFKDISYLELSGPFCSAEQNHFCNFGRGYPGDLEN